MEAWFARSVARQFLDASNRCTRDEREPAWAKGPAMIPGVVCAAFAAEVSLKAILIGEGKPSHGHLLADLFARVSDGLKEEVIKQTGYAPDRFSAELALVSNAFVEWRYVFEEATSKTVSQQFLQLLASSAMRVAERFNAA